MSAIVLGLRENWRQFSLLVVVSAFVGAMVGTERAVLPLIATGEFHLATTRAALSFIAAFGLTKALTNLVAGHLVDVRGRRWTLIAGWIVALPVPIIILAATSWSWILFANALLGVNQGLTWSTTVIMKIDLVGPKRRGLAMGLNEFAGYLAVAGAALASGVVAARFGLRAGPSYLGLAIAVTGLVASVFFVRETIAYAELEEKHTATPAPDGRRATTRELLARSAWRDANLFSVSQAGLVNNLNDGLAWGLFPLVFVSAGLSLRDTAVLAAIYPGVWGICQIGTGAVSDRLGRKGLIVSGMLLQGLALAAMPLWRGFSAWAGALIALGVGTAMVYPTLLAAVSDIARPSERGATVGVYRLWRDLGYVVGAIIAGVLADTIGMMGAIAVVAALTAASGLVVAFRLNARPRARESRVDTIVQQPLPGVR